MTERRGQRLRWAALGSLATLTLLAGAWWWPATTKKAVGTRIETHAIPLGIKASSFLYRHWMYQHLVSGIVAGHPTARGRVDAIFDWTVAHIRTDVPAGWVVEDDHPLHVIIRGYGLNWQVADVFTILCSYAGVPAVMAKAMADEGRWIVVALVQLDGAWCVVDPYYRNRFEREDGRLTTLQEMGADPARAGRAPNQPMVQGLPYADYFRTIVPLNAGPELRPLKQMWWPRLWFEIRRLGHRVMGGGA